MSIYFSPTGKESSWNYSALFQNNHCTINGIDLSIIHVLLPVQSNINNASATGKSDGRTDPSEKIALHAPNTKKYWDYFDEICRSKLNELKSLNHPTCILAEVTLYKKIENNILENLIYFFVYANRYASLLPQKSPVQFGLVVNTPDDESLYRLKAYFLMIAGNNPRYNLLYRSNQDHKIVYPLSVNPTNQHPGRLFPLLHVVPPNSNHTFSGDVNIEELLDTIIPTDSSNNSAHRLSDDDIYNYLTTSVKIDQCNTLLDCCRIYLQRLATDCTGKQGDPIKKNKKSEILHQLADEIVKRRKQMSMLAELCWIFNLDILLQDKDLIQNNKLRHSLIQRSYLDSITYTDGIAQLLENSCQHSQTHSAYLSLHMFPVKRDESVSDKTLEENISNRMMLNQKFQIISHNLYQTSWYLDPSASYYLNVSLIDDCCDCNLNPIGILTVFNRNRQKNDSEHALPEPQYLSELYSGQLTRTSHNAESIIHHYGLSAMKQIILNNGGIFLVKSPVVNAKKGKSRIDTHIATVSNFAYEELRKEFKKQKKTTSEAKFLQEMRKKTVIQEISSTSEYHLLIPLGHHNNISSKDEIADPISRWYFDPRYIYSTDIRTIRWDIVSKTFTQNHPTDPKRHYIEFSEDSCRFLEQNSKIEKVDAAYHTYMQIRKSLQYIPKETIELFVLKNINDLQVELFSKFLFRCVLDANYNSTYYAVYFNNTLQEQAFLRLFAIFYNRLEADTRNKISGVQIAMCNQHESLNIPQVNVILNLSNWGILYHSARRYAYTNLDSAKDLYSQLRYFTVLDPTSDLPQKKLGTTETAALQFPFELYLKENPNQSEESENEDSNNISIAESKDCWFLRRIGKYLTQDLQQMKFGVKIDNVHTYLPTGVHLNTFYAAELLFHNISYVWQFAFLLARDVLKPYTPTSPEIKEKTKWVVIGYEAYSSLLEQYFATYLNDALNAMARESNQDEPDLDWVEQIIVYQEKKGTLEFQIPDSLINSNDISNRKYVVLFPIGTTMSTVYLLYESLKHALGLNKDVALQSIVMILVENRNDRENLQAQFWIDDKVNGNISLQHVPEDCKSAAYFIRVKSDWHDPQNCAGSNDETVLVHADSTSTELNMIFPQKFSVAALPEVTDSNRQKMLSVSQNSSSGSHGLSWEICHSHDVCSLMTYTDFQNDNRKRIDDLAQCIYYGHLRRGANHFAFYIDIPRYYSVITKPSDGNSNYSKWIGKLSREWHNKNKVPDNTFHIVVSPLRNGISPLLKDLSDSVFEHSLHILQIDILNCRRTDILAKYGFIAEEYSELCASDPEAKICLYYVDDSIVTGETLHRGLNIVNMLLSEGGCTERRSIYDGVYVLINRSSRDTVQTFVRSPDQDFHAFLHLAIPHYNTHADKCPTCERCRKYENLISQASTNFSVREFQRLSEKNKLRTYQEYTQWQQASILTNPNAFKKLRQWVYTCHKNDPEIKEIKQVLKEMEHSFYEEFSQNDARYFSNLRGRPTSESKNLRKHFLHALESETLAVRLSKLHYDHPKYDATIKLFQKIWFHRVLAEKAFRRLKSTHNAYAYLCLEKEIINSSDHQNSGNELIDRSIYNFMRNSIFELLKQPFTDNSYETENCENLISSIKVISRDYIARHHIVRELIFEILHGIVEELLGLHPGKHLQEQEILTAMNKEDPITLTKKSSKIHPLLKYQLYISAMYALSNMESNYVVLNMSDILPQILDKFEDTFFEVNMGMDGLKRLWYHCPIPSREKRRFDLEKCIKFSAVAEDENNKSVLIQKHLMKEK